MLNKRGFTLMEALIAASVFGMLSIIGATIFINISQSQRSTESYSALYEDARVIMENLANEIRNGTVDYEEYYNIKYTNPIGGQKYYGINRGVYASRFYDPGYTMACDTKEIIQGNNPADLGVEYLDENGLPTTCSNPETDPVTLFSLSVDKDMGKYQGSAMSGNDQDELYLISKDGRSKTIIRTQTKGTEDQVLSILRLEGKDTDNNGVIDGFFCNASISGCAGATMSPFNDTNKLVAKYIDGESFDTTASPFTPISPLRSTVTDIHFIITPKEDPYKAFDEPDVQIHPSVTIVMTLEPSSTEKTTLPAGQQDQSITVQTTVATGVTSRIKSYPPTKELDWIKNAVN
ncbi:MAG TPA: prepilin-type N-terminal cleavage/methylation domain-containing protein [Candidatus Gracilibacteria bacterium]|nr:prepilin-type N-terminal cleavage/methylation domain-containing protein [Candidatus Gracilibacteria bacterium]